MIIGIKPRIDAWRKIIVGLTKFLKLRKSANFKHATSALFNTTFFDTLAR